MSETAKFAILYLVTVDFGGRKFSSQVAAWCYWYQCHLVLRCLGKYSVRLGHESHPFSKYTSFSHAFKQKGRSCLIHHGLCFPSTMASNGFEKSPTSEQVPVPRAEANTTNTVPADVDSSFEKKINENASDTTSNSIEGHDVLPPKLHLKTWLTVFAVCLIYFAQLINVVGAGAVSKTLPSMEKSRR